MALSVTDRALVEDVRRMCETPAEVMDGTWQRTRDALGAAAPELLAVIDRQDVQRTALRTDVQVALTEAREIADRTGADYARGRRDALAWFASELEEAR